jgi:hypothetical protein
MFDDSYVALEAFSGCYSKNSLVLHKKLSSINTKREKLSSPVVASIAREAGKLSRVTVTAQALLSLVVWSE